MKIQQSFVPAAHIQSGTLYLVGTPIGNLEDITYRAIHVLREADWIAAEDTRHTRKLLSHYDIHTRLVSYHEHNEQTSGADLLRKLSKGDHVALVSDAGLPAISDPGYHLVKEAIAMDIRVVPIPGANAALSALIASGLNTARFLFAGFPPKERKQREELLVSLQDEQATMLFYEAPHRILRTLQHMLDVWGERRVVLARELTKKYEEMSRGTLSQAIALLSEHRAQGEFCIVVEGKDQDDLLTRDKLWWSLLSLQDHINHYMNDGHNFKEAMRMVAVDRHVSRRDVYQAVLKEKEG